ncbi:MAG: hypothetical protein ABFS35_18660 [Bacteroidota bacterium]
MYKIDKKEYGFHLVFSDFIKADEMKRWVDDSTKALTTANGNFGVFIDMRTLKPLLPDAQEYMQQGQKLFKQKGMQRSVVILNNTITTMQFKRIARQTGIYEWERYLDASKITNWEKVGIDWLKNGTDPDA